MEKKCVICGSGTSNSNGICSHCRFVDLMNKIVKGNKKPMKMVVTPTLKGISITIQNQPILMQFHGIWFSYFPQLFA